MGGFLQVVRLELRSFLGPIRPMGGHATISGRFPYHLDYARVLLRVRSRYLRVLDLVLLVVLLRFRRPFVASRYSQRSSYYLFRGVNRYRLARVVGPRVELLATSCVRDHLHLRVLPSRVRVSYRRPTMSNFRVDVPSGVGRFPNCFLLTFSGSNGIGGYRGFVLVGGAREVLGFLLGVSTSYLYKGVLLVRVNGLRSRTRVFVVSAPSRFARFSARLRVVHDSIQRGPSGGLLRVPIQVFFLHFVHGRVLRFLRRGVRCASGSRYGL